MGLMFKRTEEESADEAVTGMDVLKAMWNIQNEPPARDMPPTEVVTDIYNTPLRSIPPRTRRPR